MLAALASAARAADCGPPTRPPNFEVRVGSLPITYDFTLDRQALATLAADSGAQIGKGHAPVGLTISSYDFTVTTQTETAPKGDIYCASLRAVTVNLGIKLLKVLADQRYPAGSCERAAVLEHEHKHVAITDEALRHYAADIGGKLEGLARPSVLTVKTMDEARTVYAKSIRQELQPLFQAIRDRAAQRNVQLDREEGDIKDLHKCTHW